MTELPLPLLRSLQGTTGFDEQAFVDVHKSGEQVVSIRINPSKFHGKPEDHFPGAVKVPWSSYGYYLPARPSFTLDPLLHAGAYYVQEASSMFIEQLVKNHAPDKPVVKVLDLCAAPGGKSTLLQSVINNNSLLVSNEVIKSRAATLTENMIKWGGDNVVVTNNDAADFSRLANFFDVMVVDAPCSGSGLFRRDPGAIQEWSEDAVTMCSLRQHRILEDAFACLSPGGLLVYSTCSYSVEENEQVCDWIVDRFNMQPVAVQISADWNIVYSESEKHHVPGYRFFPDKLKGEGFFVAGFIRTDGDLHSSTARRNRKLARASRESVASAGAWLSDPGRYHYFDLDNYCFTFPVVVSEELDKVFEAMYIKKAGIRVGRLLKNELIPDHELAVSGMAAGNLQRISLKKEDALQYLRKEEVTLQIAAKGWMLASFNDYDLGWIKALGNRHNNYYPKEWRILKAGNS